MISQLEVLQQVLQNTNGIIWAIDKQYCLLFANKAFQDAIVSSGGEEMVKGQNVLNDSYPEEFIDFWKIKYDRCLQGEKILVESNVVWSDGLHYIENSLDPIRISNGDIIGVVITSIDITSKKQTQFLLKESENKYKALYNAIPDSVFILNKESGRIEEVNQNVIKNYGYSYEEFTSLTIIDVSAEPEKTKEEMEKKSNYIPVRYHKRKDGTIFPIEITADIFEINDEKKVIAVAREISSRLDSEKLIKESEIKWRTLFEILPVGVSILDKEGKIIDFNNSLGEILGITKEGIKDEIYKNRIYLNKNKARMEKTEFPSYLALSLNEKIQNVEIGVIKENGDTIWTEVSAAPLNLPDLSCVIVTSDINKRIQKEEEILEINNELKEFNSYFVNRELRMVDLKKEINELLEKVGHEKRYPV